MALDSELLDKFERDWNDALEHYEARTTAARLGDTSVAPYNRTTLDPKIAAGMQSELFGPLQAKWGILQEGARRQAAAPAPAKPEILNTRIGVFERDPFSGEYIKKVDVPPARGIQSTPESRREMAIFNASLNRLQNARKAMMSAATRREQENAQREIEAAQADYDALQSPAQAKAPAPAPQQWEVDPETIPSGNPGNPSMFIGDPMNPVVSDPQMSPLPAGPSVQRGLKILRIRPTEER